jgi:hypothetical protein
MYVSFGIRGIHPLVVGGVSGVQDPGLSLTGAWIGGLYSGGISRGTGCWCLGGGSARNDWGLNVVVGVDSRLVAVGLAV